MKKAGLSWWCDRIWIKVMCAIAAMMMGLILWNWNTWSVGLKGIAAMAIILPLHVLEEWVFPGGFHFQYNTFLHKSDLPDRYPMNRFSDMITNLGTTVMYMIITFVCMAVGNAHPGLLLGSAIFSALEVVGHTVMGTAAYFHFKGKGKTTIYGPGSITTYTGFLPLAVILVYELQAVPMNASVWLVGVGLVAVIAVVFVLITETVFRNKNTVYHFESNGYYDRFLK